MVRVLRELALKDLDRDRPTDHRLLTAVHEADATGAQRREHAILTEHRADERIHVAVHRAHGRVLDHRLRGRRPSHERGLEPCLRTD